MMKSFFPVFIFSFLSFVSLADDGEWVFWIRKYSPIGTSVAVQPNDCLYSADTAQILAASSFPFYYNISSGLYGVNLSERLEVASNVVSDVVLRCGFYAVPATLYNDISSLVVSLANRGLNPRSFASNVVTNNNLVLFKGFQTYEFICSGLVNPDYNSSVLAFLSSIDSTASASLSALLGIYSNSQSITNTLAQVSSSMNDTVRSLYRMEEELNGIQGSIPPSTTLSAMLDVLKNIVYDGNFTSADLQSLPPEMRSHIISYNGELLPLDDVGRSFVQSMYQDVSSGIAMYQQMKGYTVGSSGVTFSGTKDDVTINGNDLSLSSFLKTSPLEQFALHSQVSMAVDTNNIKRIGGDIRDFMGRILRPESLENQQKRQLDSAAVADAIRSEFSNDGLKVHVNEPLSVNVMNWPEGGLNVSLDAPSISSIGAVFGDALSGVDRTLTSLMQDFNTWSGVDDGGRWLGVQDCLMTNIPLIVDGLLSLTNNFTNISNNLENVSSNELAQLSSELESRQDSAIAQEDSLISSFNAESYIAFAHIDQFNLSDRQNFGLLNTMANDMGVNRPDFVQINIPDFGDVHIQPIYIRVAPLFNLLEVVRWFFRCFYVLIFIGTLVMIFRLFLFSVKLLRRFTDLPLVVR